MSPTFFNLNIIEIGVFLLGIGYLYTFWRQGGAKASSQVITEYKELADLNSRKITNLEADMKVLATVVEEKDKRIALLETLVKTTPEQAQYMIEMRKFTAGVADYMASTIKNQIEDTKTLGEISVFMHNLNNGKT